MEGMDFQPFGFDRSTSQAAGTCHPVKPGDRHPFLTGRRSVRRYMTVVTTLRCVTGPLLGGLEQQEPLAISCHVV